MRAAASAARRSAARRSRRAARSRRQRATTASTSTGPTGTAGPTGARSHSAIRRLSSRTRLRTACSSGRPGDGVGQPLDLAPQLQRGGQQRLGRQTLPAQVALDPPVLVVRPVEARAAACPCPAGRRSRRAPAPAGSAARRGSRARLIRRGAAACTECGATRRGRIGHGSRTVLPPRASSTPPVSARRTRTPARTRLRRAGGQRPSSSGCSGSQVLPSAASRRRRAIPDSTSSTTRLASAEVMSAWS